MRTARIIAESLHEQIVRNYEWSEEVNPGFLRNQLTRSYKDIRVWLKSLDLRQVNLPQDEEDEEDVVPEGFPQWLKDHIEEYKKSEKDVPRVYPDKIHHIPTVDEIQEIILGWGAEWLWEWIPEVDLSWEELEAMAEPWMALGFWKDSLSENVHKIVRREAIKPHKNF